MPFTDSSVQMENAVFTGLTFQSETLKIVESNIGAPEDQNSVVFPAVQDLKFRLSWDQNVPPILQGRMVNDVWVGNVQLEDTNPANADFNIPFPTKPFATTATSDDIEVTIPAGTVQPGVYRTLVVLGLENHGTNEGVNLVHAGPVIRMIH